jgi:hypothetical protein
MTWRTRHCKPTRHSGAGPGQVPANSVTPARVDSFPYC